MLREDIGRHLSVQFYDLSVRIQSQKMQGYKTTNKEKQCNKYKSFKYKVPSDSLIKGFQ